MKPSRTRVIREAVKRGRAKKGLAAPKHNAPAREPSKKPPQPKGVLAAIARLFRGGK